MPSPPARRALFSAVLGAMLCLWGWLSLVGYAAANSVEMSNIGMFAEKAPSRQIEQLRSLWDYAAYLTLGAAALCIVLGVFRLRASTAQWVRRGAIWVLIAAAWALTHYTLEMTQPLIVA